MVTSPEAARCLEYWHCASDPFVPVVEPRSIIPARAFRLGLEGLRKAVKSRVPVTVVRGVNGIGKSTLCSVLRRAIRGGTQCVVVPPGTSIWEEIAGEFSGSLPLEEDGSSPHYHRFQLAERRSAGSAIVLIDDAHTLGHDAFKGMIQHFEATRGELCLVLFTDRHVLPVFDTWLEHRHELCEIELESLSKTETSYYITRRVELARGDARKIFSAEVAVAVHGLSAGIPGRVDELCRDALELGWREGVDTIDELLIRRAQALRSSDAAPTRSVLHTGEPADKSARDIDRSESRPATRRMTRDTLPADTPQGEESWARCALRGAVWGVIGGSAAMALLLLFVFFWAQYPRGAVVAEASLGARPGAAYLGEVPQTMPEEGTEEALRDVLEEGRVESSDSASPTIARALQPETESGTQSVAALPVSALAVEATPVANTAVHRDRPKLGEASSRVPPSASSHATTNPEEPDRNPVAAATVRVLTPSVSSGRRGSRGPVAAAAPAPRSASPSKKSMPHTPSATMGDREPKKRVTRFQAPTRRPRVPLPVDRAPELLTRAFQSLHSDTVTEKPAAENPALPPVSVARASETVRNTAPMLPPTVRRVAPEYPSRALRQSLEGWVVVGFAIGKEGEVVDPEVIASKPGRRFDVAALRAIKKWRFSPILEAGEPVEREGFRYRFTFMLDDE